MEFKLTLFQDLESFRSSNMITNKTLHNGLKVLQILSENARPYAVSEIAALLEVPPSHAHRLLQTLCAAGYAGRTTEGRKYQLTYKVFELANSLATGSQLRRKASRYLWSLTENTQSNASLLVYENEAPLIIMSDFYRGKRNRACLDIGQKMSIHASASGKLFAAILKLNPDALDLTAITKNTITNSTDFQIEMKKIRLQGYSINNCENGTDSFSVAAPVFQFEGELIAAIGSYNLKSQLSPSQEDLLISETIHAAESLSAGLGYTGDALSTKAQTAIL